MATFDLQHFFETRQELASRSGSIYAQRAIAEMREVLRVQQLNATKTRPKTVEKQKAVDKPAKKAQKTESDGDK